MQILCHNTDLVVCCTCTCLIWSDSRTHSYCVFCKNEVLFIVMYNQPLQIHVLEGGEIRIYSRNSENNTTKYPDIIARMPKVGAVLRPGLRSWNDAGVFLLSFFLPEILTVLKQPSVWTIMFNPIVTCILLMYNFPSKCLGL